MRKVQDLHASAVLGEQMDGEGCLFVPGAAGNSLLGFGGQHFVSNVEDSGDAIDYNTAWILWHKPNYTHTPLRFFGTRPNYTS